MDVSRLGLGLNLIVAKTFKRVEETDFIDAILGISISDS